MGLKLKLLSRSAFRMTKYAGVGAAAGAMAGNSAAPAGGKNAGTRDGAVLGALTGGVIASPRVAAAALALPQKGMLVFRKIRGRIIPLRIKG